MHNLGCFVAPQPSYSAQSCHLNCSQEAHLGLIVPSSGALPSFWSSSVSHEYIEREGFCFLALLLLFYPVTLSISQTPLASSYSHCTVIWQEEIIPRQWRDGLIVNIVKKGDREDPGNYRGITLLSVVGKVFCKILNNRLVQCLDKEGALHEGQAGFRLNRGCMDNVYTLNEIVQGRLREDKKTYAFFLDIQKAYDTVRLDDLWYKLWDMGVKGRMWRVIKKMYMSSRSAVLLEGEKSDSFNVDQGVAQGCSLSPILFSVFINDLLKEVEQAELGIQLSSGKTFGRMLFADDFVGVSIQRKACKSL